MPDSKPSPWRECEEAIQIYYGSRSPSPDVYKAAFNTVFNVLRAKQDSQPRFNSPPEDGRYFHEAPWQDTNMKAPSKRRPQKPRASESSAKAVRQSSYKPTQALSSICRQGRIDKKRPVVKERLAKV